jgi:transcriptional regulator with PAS, ATPase and Fis domain
MDEARTIARTREPILLLGETGTGKERLARAIHGMSSRSNGPWVPVNCASLGPELADSELFGHARGAFTGAETARDGILKSADGGTVLLDELGDLPQPTQVKLLRVFEDPRIRAKGSDKTTAINVRIIGATSLNLERAIREGRFRRDLVERFQVKLWIPPLRERPEDIEPLARHFLRIHAGAEGFNPAAKDLGSDALANLRTAPLRGNARELERAVKGALARTFTSEVETIRAEHLVLDAPQADVLSTAQAVEAVRALATALLDGLIAGAISRDTIEDIAKRFPEVSLKQQLAAVFLLRFQGSIAHEQANRLFGYTTAESVRRLLRSTAKRDVMVPESQPSADDVSEF